MLYRVNSIPGNFTPNDNDGSAAQLDSGVKGETNQLYEVSTMAVEQKGSCSNSDTIERLKTHEEDEDEKRDREIQNLARHLSTRTQHSTYQRNPFDAGEGSILDPHSPTFNPRAFAKSLLNLQARDPEKWKKRTAGFAFKELNIFGFGSMTDYQKSVGNILFEAVGLAKKFLGMSKPRKIDILQGLDGLVQNGEMLVVLGPPGRYVLLSMDSFSILTRFPVAARRSLRR